MRIREVNKTVKSHGLIRFEKWQVFCEMSDFTKLTIEKSEGSPIARVSN